MFTFAAAKIGVPVLVQWVPTIIGMSNTFYIQNQ